MGLFLSSCPYSLMLLTYHGEPATSRDKSCVPGTPELQCAVRVPFRHSFAPSPNSILESCMILVARRQPNHNNGACAPPLGRGANRFLERTARIETGFHGNASGKEMGSPSPTGRRLPGHGSCECGGHWSLTTLREKLVKIGAKVVRHARYVVFQMAEVAIPRRLFATILRRISRLCPVPV
jgi:hypothetical protein